MAEVIAIRNPTIFLDWLAANASKIFRRSKERTDGLEISLRISEKERLVKEVMDNATAYLIERLKRQDLKQIRDEITFFVAIGHSQFAKKFYKDIRGRELRKYLGAKLLESKHTGVTNASRKITGIDYQRIGENCREDNHAENAGYEARVRASLIITAIHELLHHFGDFGDKVVFGGKEYASEWLNEGIPEFLARETMKATYPRDFEKLGRQDLQQYRDELAAVMELIALVGERIVTDAFLTKDFGKITRKAEELSVSDKLEELLKNPFKRRKKPEEEPEEKKPAQALRFRYSVDVGEISEKYSLDSQPGLALDTIRAVREILPPDQRDAAARMALQATLCFKFNSDHEPTGEEVVEKVAGALEKNGGIIAYAQRDLMAEATRGLPEAFASMIIPNKEVDACKKVAFTEPIKNGSELSASLNLKFGDDIDFDTASAVESAAINYTMTNNGAIAGPFELVETVYGGYADAGMQESMTPDASIVTDYLLTEANRLIQDTGMPQDGWVRATARELLANETNKRIKELQHEPYDEKNHHSLAQYLERYPEFRGYSDVLIESASALFSNMGATPTCGDIIGLLATSCQIAQDTQLATYHERTGPIGIPCYNPIAYATSDVLDNMEIMLKNEHVKQLEAAPAQDRLEGVDSYWSSKPDGAANPVMKGATEVFATLLEVRRPSDAIDIVPVIGVVRTGADGSRKLPNADAYAESEMIMGATQDVFDPRKCKRIVETIAPSKDKPELMGAFGKRIEYAIQLCIGGIEDPLRITPDIKTIAEKADSDSVEPLGKIRKLFDMVKRGGELKIKGSMFMDDRKTGSKTPQQILDDKKANCLELTSLFVMAAEHIFARNGRARVIALDVINPEQRIEIGHVCAGVLIESDDITGHPRFANDWEFRRKLLEQLGVPDSPRLKLLVLDPVNCIFDYRFDNIAYLDKRKLASCHYSNSGIYSWKRGEDTNAERNFELAKRLWGNNPSVLVHVGHKNIKNKPEVALEMLHRMDEDYISSEILAMMGIASFNARRPDEALKFYDGALRLNKNNKNALHGKGSVHLSIIDRKNLEAAERCFRRLLEVERHSRIHDKTMVWMAMHETKEFDAQFGLKELCETDSGLVGIYTRLAVIYMCLGDFRKAGDICDRGLRNAIDDETLNLLKAFAILGPNGRGIIILEQQAPSQEMDALKEQCWQRIRVAEQILDRVLASSNSVMGHLGKAMCAALREDKKERNQHLEAAEREEPKYAKTMQKIKSSSLDVFPYYDIFLMLQLTKLTNLRIDKDFDELWKQMTSSMVVHEEHEEVPSRLQISGLENRLESSAGKNEKIRPETLERVLEQTRKYAEKRLRILDSDLTDLEKSILLYFVESGCNNTMHLEQCVLFQRYLTGIRTISDAELEREVSELRTLIKENPMRFDRNLLRELANFAKQHNLETEDEILALTKRTLKQDGKPLTKENVELYLPIVRRICAIKRSPFGKTGHLDVHGLRVV